MIQPQIDWDPAANNIIVRWNPGFRTETTGFVDQATTAEKNSGVVLVDLASNLDIDDIVVRLNPSHFDASLFSHGTPYSGGYFNYWVEQTSETAFSIFWESEKKRSSVSFSYKYDHF